MHILCIPIQIFDFEVIFWNNISQNHPDQTCRVPEAEGVSQEM